MKNSIKKAYYCFVALLWAMLTALFLFQYLTEASPEEAILFCISLFVPSGITSFYLSNSLLPKAIWGKRMKQFVIQFITITLLTGVIHLIVFIVFEKLEEAELFEPTRLMKIQYPVLVEYIMTLPAIFMINLDFCGLRFYFEHIKLQQLHSKAQLQVLQQQINPHFMFNVLNHIYILMQKDVTRASDLLVNYSEILRYQLYKGKKETVTLGEEEQFLKDLINVEKTRWGNELKVECQWNIEDKQKEIQPLLLITLVENAFKHVSRSLSEKGYINILLEQKEDSLCMEVENSKSTQGVKKADSSGLGLQNTKERLEILYFKKHSLVIKETEEVYIIQLNITL